jgi:hypothetical protein
MQAIMTDAQILQRIKQSDTCIEVLANVFSEYAQRTALGHCPPGENGFVTLTYAQTWERVQVKI